MDVDSLPNFLIENNVTEVVSQLELTELFERTMECFDESDISKAVSRIDACASNVDVYSLVTTVRDALFSVMPEEGISCEDLRDFASSFGVDDFAVFNEFFFDRGFDVSNVSVVENLCSVARAILRQWMLECFGDEEDIGMAQDGNDGSDVVFDDGVDRPWRDGGLYGFFVDGGERVVVDSTLVNLNPVNLA